MQAQRQTQSSTDRSFFSKPKNAKSGSSTPVTRTVVTTRVITTHKSAGTSKPSGAVKEVARGGTPAVSRASHSATPPPEAARKRKTPHDQSAAPPKVKKPRLSTSPSTSRASSLAPSTHLSIPSTRQSSLAPRGAGRTSRSTSVVPLQPIPPVPRDLWIEEDGRLGPGFVSCEEVVKKLMPTYKAYFTNPHDPNDKAFEPHSTHYPVVELEYPNTNAAERFVLLVPKDKDHYNPIMCLEKSLHTIIENYLTPEQRELFGTLPNTTLLDVTDETVPDPPPLTVPVDSPSPATVSSTPYSVSSPSACSDTSVSSVSSTTSISSTLSSLTSLSSIADLIPASSTPSSQPPSINFLRLLRRAINQRDGPQFLKVMDGINTLLRSFKYPLLSPDPFDPTPPNHLLDAVKTWSLSAPPRNVLQRIIDETYQRTVGPQAQRLNHCYKAFSSETYGELMPSFVSQIIKDTGLNSEKLFLDLGSGVGNVVLQASLETGCQSFGIEIQPIPAGLAREQLEQFKTRCRMWGVRMGEVELEEGDMLRSPRVDELIAKADVVLINNKVFEGSLNEAIKPKFLDMKEGAMVVSLQSFVTTGRGSERNINDISAIFKHYVKEYYSGSVSWGSGGGQYYIHEVDRVGCMAAKEALVPTRSTRSRR